MFIFLLQCMYYTMCTVMYPFNLWWDYMFRIDFHESKDKIIIFDAIGGSGKTTLAEFITRYGDYRHIRLDNCKYGENWKRYTPNEYIEHLHDEIKLSKSSVSAFFKTNGEYERYVIEGVYDDPKLSVQREENNKLIVEADIVIWYDIPKLVAIWRKLFRSFKRMINVAPQGAAVEKWKNVKAMFNKNMETFESRYNTINVMWKIHQYDNNDINKFRHIQWPFYYGNTI
jgi:hypothetical protein